MLTLANAPVAYFAVIPSLISRFAIILFDHIGE